MSRSTIMFFVLVFATGWASSGSPKNNNMDQREIYKDGNVYKNGSAIWSIFPYDDDVNSTQQNCGGFLEVKETVDLLHELPFPTNNGPYGLNGLCAWVVWASNGGPIRIKLNRNSTVKFGNSFELKVHNVYGSISASHREFKNRIIDLSRDGEALCRTDDVGGAEGYFPYVIIHFRGQATKRGQGFHLRIADEGRGFFHRVRPTTVTLPARSTSAIFKHPRPPASSYGRHERLFIIIRPKLREKILVELLSIDTEQHFDWIMTSYLDSSSPGGVRREILVERIKDKTMKLEADVPLVLIFSSDGSDERRGFRIRYSSVK